MCNTYGWLQYDEAGTIYNTLTKVTANASVIELEAINMFHSKDSHPVLRHRRAKSSLQMLWLHGQKCTTMFLIVVFFGF
jgi:hypothetical protein